LFSCATEIRAEADILRRAIRTLQRALIYLLYWTLQLVAFPFLLLYLLLRVLRDRRYADHLGERFGFLPAALERTVPGAIWLHAVSVGEAITAVQLIRRLRTEMPWAPVYVSCSTVAGRAMAEEKLKGLAAGVFYAPVDYRFAVRRVLRSLKPQAVIVMETEIWPNLYRDAKVFGAALVLVNGRISDKALPSYRRWAWAFRAALSWPDAVLAQDEIAAIRYSELGAQSVTDAGNLKYDFEPSTAAPAPAVVRFIENVRPAKVWVAASTMPPARDGDVDEDDAVINAFQLLSEQYKRLLLIHVPRKPERFDEVAERLAAAGIAHVRRTDLTLETALDMPGVLLLDTIGELAALFSLVDVVFMGGSLAERGGHNPLEPAAFGKPVVTGPNMQNFFGINALLKKADAVVSIRDAAELPVAIGSLLIDPARAERIGSNAKRTADSQRGATARAAEAVAGLYDKALPTPCPMLPARIALGGLSHIWSTGVRADRAMKNMGLQLPGVPVISVGNLAMGGTGKTPFVVWLAGRLHEEGKRVGILTRGYGRDSVTTLGLPPGKEATVADTGEEAQLYVRDGRFGVGIGSDRLSAYWALGRAGFQPDVLLLDDGFQHWRMRRELDIVLIDTLDPFRGGVFPLGTLREPFAALERAGCVVLTRARAGRGYEGLIGEIRKFNATVPILPAYVVAETPDLPEGRVGAFCGLGQPETFRDTLRDAGVAVEFFERFPDHHHYKREEIAAMARRADVLVTTEKDLMNIRYDVAAEFGVKTVRMGIRVEGEAALLSLTGRALQAEAERA
jgi:tetraacyldisaccharide 4'-kinase